MNRPSAPPSNWILDSDLPPDHPDYPRPRTRRSGSDSLVDEIKKIREDGGDSDDGHGTNGGSDGGLGIQRTISNTSSAGDTSASAGTFGSKKEVMETVAPAFPWDAATTTSGQWLGEALWRPFEALQNPQMMWSPPRSPLLEEMMSMRRDNTGGGNGRRESRDDGNEQPAMTELDYYDFFERQMAGMRKVMDGVGAKDMIVRGNRCTGGGGVKIESAYEETRTVRDADGIVRTQRVQVRRFADGREERIETEDTRLPEPRIMHQQQQQQMRPDIGVLAAVERTKSNEWGR